MQSSLTQPSRHRDIGQNPWAQHEVDAKPYQPYSSIPLIHDLLARAGGLPKISSDPYIAHIRIAIRQLPDICKKATCDCDDSPEKLSADGAA